MRIGLVAAMREECAPLLRRVRGTARGRAGRFRCWTFPFGNHESCLIRSGMGLANAVEATSTLVSHHGPEIIVSFGFGGAISGGIGVGDLVLARELLRYQDGGFHARPGPDPGLTGQALKLLDRDAAATGCRATGGFFVTTDGIVNKREIAGLLGREGGYGVLEMETCGVAQVAAKAGIPMVALRSVSDTEDEELDFSIADFAGPDLEISIWRVLKTIAGKPRIIPQLISLSRNSRLAGESLASGVLAILRGL